MTGPETFIRRYLGVPAGRLTGSLARIISCGILLGLLTGCFETKQEITLNPDGSGKVTLESTITEVEPLLFDDIPAGWEESASQAVRKLLEKAEGVDAWKDLSFREMEDGRMFVRATAYFSDLSKLKTDLNSFLRFRVTKDANGQLVIQPRPDTSRSPIRFPTNEVLTAQTIRRTRKQFRALKPLLVWSFGAIKLDTIIHVSGEVRTASNFEAKGARSLRLQFDGSRLLAVIEELLFDPEISRRLLAGDMELTGHFVNEKLYGQQALVVAVIKPGGKPLFDYATEVAEARKAFPATARALGIEGSPPPPKSTKEGLAARVAVTEVKFRSVDGKKSGLHFGNHSSPYTVCLKGDLSGAVSDIGEIQLTRAVTIEGISLVPLDSSRHGFRHVSNGGTNVDFEVCLQAPPLNSKGLAELAGYLECGSADNRRSIELFSGRLAQGAKGKAFGAEIEFVGPNPDGGERLVLRADLEEEKMRSFKVFGDAGQMVDLSQQGVMMLGAQRSYTFVASATIPRSGRLVAEIVIGSQKVRIPFVVTNVSLLGQPLASR